MTTEGIARAPASEEKVNLEGCENVVPLAEWFEKHQDDPEMCAPCNLAVIAPWYRETLKEAGLNELADRVQALAGGDPDIEEVVRVLDRVKEDVQNDEVRGNLVLFDCMMQNWEDEQGEVSSG